MSTVSDYRFAPPLVLRLLGLLVVLFGLLVAAVAAAVAWLALPSAVFTAVLVVVVLGVIGAGLALTRLPWLVRLDQTGYRVRLLRRAGVRSARWRDVEDVVTARVSGHDVVVIRLRDGRSTTVPVEVLDAPRERFLVDLGQHLDAGHGYRRLR